MYRKILVPLDGSPLAEEVLPAVTALVGSAPTQVVLVRIVHPPAPTLVADSVMPFPENVPPGGDDPAAALAMSLKAAEDYLELVAARLRRDCGMDVLCEVREGAPAHELVQAATERSVDLIALCTHGRSGLRRLVFGSVADRILREAGRPVLLVKAFKEAAQPGARKMEAPQRRAVTQHLGFRIVRRVHRTPPFDEAWHEYLAFDEEQLVGRVSALEAPLGSKECWIDDLWVDRIHRRSGLGSELLKVILLNAKARGYEKVVAELTPYDTTPGSVVEAFYQKHGFDIVEHWEGGASRVGILFL